MRIAIVGLGAIGGFFAARLAASGAQVCALARGATLAAVRRNGLQLIEASSDTAGAGARAVSVPLRVSDHAAELGMQDLVILSVKTTGLADVAGQIAPMIGPQTNILSAMNGIPWWFFHGVKADMAHALAALPLSSIDSGGALLRCLPPKQIIGCVTHMSASTPEPGVVRQNAGQRLIIGEPDGRDPAASPRCADVIALFSRAGFQVEPTRNIQQDIWFKLWGNMTMNPISAITGATGDRILDDDKVRDFMSRCMLEAAAIGDRVGLPIDTKPEERHAITRKLGALKTSMLQDAQAGRAVELDALLAVVVEIGERVNVATPNLDSLLGLARLHGRVHGLYPVAPALGR